jgi:O-antigen ligase
MWWSAAFRGEVGTAGMANGFDEFWSTTVKILVWAILPFAVVLMVPKESAYGYFLASVGLLGLIFLISHAASFGMPEALLCGLMFSTNSAFVDPTFLPRLPFFGGSLFFSDFYLVLACLWMWISTTRRKEQLSFSYKKHFLVLGGIVALSVFIALSRGAEVHYILRESHMLVYYPLTILLVCWAIRNSEGEFRLLLVLCSIVVVSCVATFWQIVLINHFQFMAYASQVFDLKGDALDALRIRPLSQWLFVCFLVGSVGAYPLWKKRRVSILGVLTLVTICLFLGFSRVYVADVAAGLGCILLIRKQDLSGSLRTAAKVFLAAAIICFSLRATMKQIAPAYWGAFEDRIATSLTTNALQSDDPFTFGSRLYEMQSAIGHIGNHPILGLGVGMEYRDIMPFEYAQTDVRENPDDAVHYMHDTYLYFWMKYGLLGALAAVWVIGHFLSRTWALARQAGDQAALFVGILAAFAALAVSNLVSPSFLDSPAAPTLVGLMAGLVEVGHQRLARTKSILEPRTS